MKKVVVLGAGESGTGAAVLGTMRGFEVWVSDNGRIKEKYKAILDKHKIAWEEQGHTIDQMEGADIVVKSPGIPDYAGIIVHFISKDIPVISEIEWASRFTDATFIGITGSNGKTTTTNLTYEIFRKAFDDVGLAGNVGYSLANLVATEKFSTYVVELSSFQLDGIQDFKPKVAVLLNVTPDHLDRYENKVENYVASKFRVLMNQDDTDFFIYNYDDPIIRDYMTQHKINANKLPISIEQELEYGAWLTKDKINININNNLFDMSIYDLALKGKHNVYNSMASAVAARVLDIGKEDIRDCLKGFRGIEHRLEFVGRVDGIKFINDSKATNVNAVWYALDSADEPIVWIVGGIDKGNNYKDLKPLVNEKVKAIICLGKENEKIIKAFEKHVDTMVETQSAKEAVSIAKSLSNVGDTVLLSPACASFDLFENYEDRGHQFKQAVKEL